MLSIQVKFPYFLLQGDKKAREGGKEIEFEPEMSPLNSMHKGMNLRGGQEHEEGVKTFLE